MKKLLPIGSVVKLKDVPQKVMIVGHLVSAADDGKQWDYAAVHYPQGLIDPEKFILFDHGSIELMHFIGLQDAEGLAYMKEMFITLNGLDEADEEEDNLDEN